MKHTYENNIAMTIQLQSGAHGSISSISSKGSGWPTWATFLSDNPQGGQWYCVCLNTRTRRKWLSEKPLWEQRKVFGAKIKNEARVAITWSPIHYNGCVIPLCSLVFNKLLNSEPCNLLVTNWILLMTQLYTRLSWACGRVFHRVSELW